MARKLKTCDLRCRSQFNVTCCAGEMHQHTWALRMARAIQALERESPGSQKHTFIGSRWQKLQEIQAIEQLTGSLTMKCQTEGVATAGYWWYWLEQAFRTLAGHISLQVVDIEKVSRSPKLPI